MSDKSANSNGQPMSSSISPKEIWNRVGHVEVIVWKGPNAKHYNFDGLDFKFSVTQILGRMPEGNMNVSICNLSQDTANELVTLCNVADALKQRKTLKLYAGYADPENKDYKGELLCTMDIINATITSPPPEIWLQITAVYAGWLNDLKFSIDLMDILVRGSALVGRPAELGDKLSQATARDVGIDDCIEKICESLNKLQEARGVKVRYKYDLSHIQDGYFFDTPGTTKHLTFTGTLAEIPTKISETYKVNALWETREDNDIYLAVYPDPRHKKGLTEEEKSKFTRGSVIKFLDVDHGLIGIPKLKDSINLECRCFLDGKIKAGDYVSVKSEMLPVIYEKGELIKPQNKSLAAMWGSSHWKGEKDLNTIKAFQIMRIKYTGHLRGGEWYCDIEARCPMAVSSLVENEEIAPIALTENYSKLTEGWSYDKETGVMTKPAD